MSTYITESRSKYEVADRKLDEAVKWLDDEMGCCHVRTEACRQRTSIVTADTEMFGGSVPYGWSDNVKEFMELFCLPGSYATFRDDEEFAWYMAELKSDGCVAWSVEQAANPFEERCDKLENE